jgi:hypothetical protein
MKISTYLLHQSILKQIILFVFIAISGIVKAQDFIPSKALVKWDQQRIAIKKRNPTEVYYAKINRTFEITPHILINGKDTIISLATIDAFLDSVNTFYKPIGISFTTCSAKYFRGEALDTVSTCWWNNNTKEYTKKDYEPYTINMYFLKGIMYGDSRSTVSYPAGFAPMPLADPTHSQDAVFISRDNNGFQPVVLAHELGHFFGLYHPHESQTYGKEFVNESNCASSGDLMCDTPAEPEESLSGLVDMDCNYIGNTIGSYLDPNGKGYVPSTTNVMSYTLPQCVKGFTQEQFERMIACYYNWKTYLR